MIHKLQRVEFVQGFQGVGHQSTSFDDTTHDIYEVEGVGILVIGKSWRPADAASQQAFLYPPEACVRMPADDFVQAVVGAYNDPGESKGSGGKKR